MKGWAPRLFLRKRLTVIRKWPIDGAKALCYLKQAQHYHHNIKDLITWLNGDRPLASQGRLLNEQHCCVQGAKKITVYINKGIQFWGHMSGK